MPLQILTELSVGELKHCQYLVAVLQQSLTGIPSNLVQLSCKGIVLVLEFLSIFMKVTLQISLKVDQQQWKEYMQHKS